MELKIELQREPNAVLIFDKDWQCSNCFRNTRLLLEGKDSHCIFCCIDGSGKDHVIVLGWHLAKASFNQINASRIDK